MVEMEKVKFSLKPIEEKPTRTYRKGSKYDPILKAFLEGKDKLATVSVENKDPNYLRTQINKRINAKGYKVTVSVVGNQVYLEKA